MTFNKLALNTLNTSEKSIELNTPSTSFYVAEFSCKTITSALVGLF